MRVALFGVGRMGTHHARHLQSLGVDLQLYDPGRGHTSWPTGPLDAAVIASPTVTHAALATELAGAGIPVLVEKPLAATLEEAARLAEYPHVYVGHTERFNPAFSLAPQDAAFVQAERLAPFSGRSTDIDVVLDLMVHDIDLFLSLCGEDPVVDIRANGVAVTTGCTDIAQARLETRAGKVATLTASRVSNEPIRRFRAFRAGEYISLDLKDRRAHRVCWGEQLVQAALEVPAWDALNRELSQFLSAARGESVFPIPARTGFQVLEVATRIQQQIAATQPPCGF